MMVKPTYMKAAHIARLKEVLLKGMITPVGERESQTNRVVLHVFRDLIKNDLFEWFVIGFNRPLRSRKRRGRSTISRRQSRSSRRPFLVVLDQRSNIISFLRCIVPNI